MPRAHQVHRYLLWFFFIPEGCGQTAGVSRTRCLWAKGAPLLHRSRLESGLPTEVPSAPNTPKVLAPSITKLDCLIFAWFKIIDLPKGPNQWPHPAKDTLLHFNDPLVLFSSSEWPLKKKGRRHHQECSEWVSKVADTVKPVNQEELWKERKWWYYRANLLDSGVRSTRRMHLTLAHLTRKIPKVSSFNQFAILAKLSFAQRGEVVKTWGPHENLLCP